MAGFIEGVGDEVRLSFLFICVPFHFDLVVSFIYGMEKVQFFNGDLKVLKSG